MPQVASSLLTSDFAGVTAAVSYIGGVGAAVITHVRVVVAGIGGRLCGCLPLVVPDLCSAEVDRFLPRLLTNSKSLLDHESLRTSLSTQMLSEDGGLHSFVKCRTKQLEAASVRYPSTFEDNCKNTSHARFRPLALQQCIRSACSRERSSLQPPQ